MNQPYAVWEVMLYAFLDSFPYMMLGLFAFRDCLRFNKRLTAMLLALVEVLFVALVTISLMTRRIPMDIVDIVLSLLYIGFTFLVIRDHPGKLLFTVLVLLNLGNLGVVCGKCLEGQLFPELAQQVYRYTFFLCKLPLQAILLPLSYHLIFRDIRSTGEDDEAFPEQQAAQHWKYLWLVPGVFYLIWMLNFYNKPEFRKEDAEAFIARRLADLGTSVSETTLERDVDCFVRTYSGAKGKGGEESFDSPFLALRLLQPTSDPGLYRFNIGKKSNLPNELVGYAILRYMESIGGELSVSLSRLLFDPKSPGQVFKLDQGALVDAVLELGDRRGAKLSYSDTAGLNTVQYKGDRLRLRKDADGFLRSHYAEGARR